MNNNFSKNLLSSLNQKSGEINPTIYGNPKTSRQDMIEQNKFNYQMNNKPVENSQPIPRQQGIGRVDPMKNITEPNQDIRRAANIKPNNGGFIPNNFKK